MEWRKVRGKGRKGKGIGRKDEGGKERENPGGGGSDPEEPSGGASNPGGPASGSDGRGAIAIRAFRIVRDRGQEWDLVDQEQSEQRTEDETGPRTEGELPEFPVLGCPERYICYGRPFPRVP